MRDLKDSIKPVNTLKPDAYAIGAVNGTVIDRAGFDSCCFVLAAGTNGAGGTVDVKIQHGEKADGSDMADVANLAFVQVTEANDETTYKLAYTGTKRYVRAVATVATAACDFGVLAVLGHPRYAPVE